MNTNTQHGRQPAPQQTAPPTDPRTRNHSPPATSGDSPGGICRDFIWGICAMGAQCIYRHELEFEAMKSVLKFCHDHQNRTGCTRPDCTYLHASREEQNLFLATGQIPRVLIDRYTGISNTSAATPPVSENVVSAPPPQPHHMMYEYITQPPPPPPPPPTQATVGAGVQHSPIHNMHSSMQGPILGPLSGLMQGPIPSPMQGAIPGPMQSTIPGPIQGPLPGPMTGPLHGPMPMPAPMPPIPAPMPPPPPPPPPTSSVSSTRMTGPIYSAPLPTHQNMTSLYHQTIPQTALPPMFDPTRPPPPIPQATPSRLLKRTTDEIEAGPSKVRKVDSTNDSPCECCVQRLIRIDQLNQQMEQLELEAEQARAEVSLKMDSYEKRKLVLRSIFTSPEMYRRAEDYVENGSQSPFSMRNEVFNTNIFSSPVTSSMNTNSNMGQQLLELLLGNSTRGLMESMPSSSVADDPVGLLPLAARARPNKSSTDILSTLLNLLKNVPSSASTSVGSEAETTRASTSGNGYSRYLSVSPPARARPLPHPHPHPLPLPLPVPEAGGSAGGQRLLEPPPQYAQAPPPVAALPYDAGVPRYPPPPRHFPPPPPEPHPHPAHAAPPRGLYAHAHYAPAHNNVANPPYPGAALNQPQRPPMPPQQQAQNNPYFMGSRYPNQHYYPPYQ